MDHARTLDPAPVVASSMSADRDLASPTLNAHFRKQFRAPSPLFTLDVDLNATPGFTILFGSSGAGKTTLLDCVAGLTTPDTGQISIADRVLFDAAQRINLPVAKRCVGYVFQNLALFPHMTVEQNVHYGLAHLPRNERNNRTSAILQAFRITHLTQRSVREISGGEAQRTALARTLVTDPAVLLLDEPLAALDSPTKADIIDDLREWNRTHSIPILYVTHSRDEVFALGERVIVLEAGRIVAQGTPHEVMTAPTQETVAQLAGFENIFDAEVGSVHPDRGTMVCKIMAGRLVPREPASIEPPPRESGSSEAGKGTASAVPKGNKFQTALAAEAAASVLLETPLVRGGVGSAFRIGIRAGDILLATSPPVGLSARNIIPGRIQSLDQRDVIVYARVKCRGVEMEVQLTLAARNSLELEAGKEVWLVIKTHSCHLMQR
jgi:molybdate transport system ATP-binding protein